MASESTSSGIGCTGLLTVMLTTLFIGLKLTGYIDWSWWWVLSPIWINLCLVVVVFAVILGLGVLLEALK